MLTTDELTASSFVPSYRALQEPPILSFSFRAAQGSLRKNPKLEHAVLQAFFSNLLPRDKLVEALRATALSQNLILCRFGFA